MALVFTCAECGRVCQSDRDEAEAEAELEERFGGQFMKEECAIVCEDCYNRIMGSVQ